MEVQWQLVLFTLFVCLGAGTLAVTGLLGLLGKDDKVRLPGLLVSLVSLGIGGFASLFHIQHWERMFNGFGHLSSGITQELFAMVIMVIAIVVYFIVSRKGTTPKWAGIMAIIVAFLMVFTMTHSYLMPSRPLWNNALLYLFYFANMILFGGLCVAILCGIKDVSGSIACKVALVGAALQAVAAIGYAVFIPKVGKVFTSVPYYFDPNNPTKDIMDPAGIFSGYLGGDGLVLFWILAVVIGIVLPLVAAILGDKKTGKNLVLFAGIGLACALIGGIAFRVLLYDLGFSLFVFY